MDNKSKGDVGERFVKQHLEKQGYIVTPRKKGETGFDLTARKGKKTFTVEVKTTANLEGGVPDMHSSEFRRRGHDLLFVADMLYIVRILPHKKLQLEILTTEEIDKYSKDHTEVTRIRTRKLQRALKRQELGKREVFSLPSTL